MDSTPILRKNKHLNASECYKLEVLLKAKMKVSEIAQILEKHISTIYREIKRGTVEFRNSDLSIRKEYSAYYSLNVRKELMSKSGRKLLYRDLHPELLSYIQSKLDDKYSPDAISGELKKVGVYTICTQGSKTALLVLTERVSRFEIIVKLRDKTQKSIIAALDKLEKEYKDKFSLIFKSITVDNGVEVKSKNDCEKKL